MSYRSFSLIPAFSNNLLSDRFNQMDNLFSRITGEKPLSDTPAYDLLQKDKDIYELSVSVPGFTKDELDISVLNNKLTIIGKPQINEKNKSKEKYIIKWINHGIIKNNFSFSFNLEHRLKIKNVFLDKGLLIIQFIYDIPEQEKPQKIKINTSNDSKRIIEQNII